DFPSALILEHADDRARMDVDDLAGRGISIFAVDAHRDPPRLVVDFDFRDLRRRHCGGIKDMNPLVERGGEPEFLFVGVGPEAMTRAPVALGRPGLVPLHRHAAKALARLQIADLEAEQLVDVDEAEGLSAVNREGADRRAEWADLANGLE